MGGRTGCCEQGVSTKLLRRPVVVVGRAGRGRRAAGRSVTRGAGGRVCNAVLAHACAMHACSNVRLAGSRCCRSPGGLLARSRRAAQVSACSAMSSTAKARPQMGQGTLLELRPVEARPRTISAPLERQVGGPQHGLCFFSTRARRWCWGSGWQGKGRRGRGRRVVDDMIASVCVKRGW